MHASTRQELDTFLSSITPDSRIFYLDPRLAQYALDAYPAEAGNARVIIGDVKVRIYSKKMLSREWELGYPIVFGWSGGKAAREAGMHRLHAVVLSGESDPTIVVPFWVQRGSTLGHFAFDDNLRPAASQYSTFPYKKVALPAGNIIGYLTGRIPKPSVTQVLEGLSPRGGERSWLIPVQMQIAEEWQAEFAEFAPQVLQANKHYQITSGLHLAVLAMASRTEYQKKISDWLAVVSTGDWNAAKDYTVNANEDPRLYLGRRFNDKNSGDLRIAQHPRKPYNLIVRCWNRYVEDGQVAKAISPADDRIEPIKGFTYTPVGGQDKRRKK